MKGMYLIVNDLLVDKGFITRSDFVCHWITGEQRYICSGRRNMESKKHRPGEIDAMYFDKLPQRCKEMVFEYLSCEFPYEVTGDKAFYFDVCS